MFFGGPPLGTHRAMVAGLSTPSSMPAFKARAWLEAWGRASQACCSNVTVDPSPSSRCCFHPQDLAPASPCLWFGERPCIVILPRFLARQRYFFREFEMRAEQHLGVGVTVFGHNPRCLGRRASVVVQRPVDLVHSFAVEWLPPVPRPAASKSGCCAPCLVLLLEAGNVLINIYMPKSVVLQFCANALFQYFIMGGERLRLSSYCCRLSSDSLPSCSCCLQ